MLPVPRVRHTACHCPNVQCFEYNEYGHIAADCPGRLPPSGMPACHKDNTLAQDIDPDLLLDTAIGTAQNNKSRSQSHSCRY